MSSEEHIETTSRLSKAYTFAESEFDFADARTERPFYSFGVREIAQNIVERAAVNGDSSGQRHMYTDVNARIGVSEERTHTMERFTTIVEAVGVRGGIPPYRYTEIVEHVGVSSSYHREAEMHMSVSEGIGMGGGVNRAPMQNVDLADGVGIVDAYVNILDRCIMLREHVGISGGMVLVPSLRTDVVEHVSVVKAEAPIIPARRTVETGRIALLDAFGAEQSPHTVEGEWVGVADRHVFIRAPHTVITERIGVSGARVFVPALQSVFHEHISVYDRLPQASGASLSSVAIGRGMTLEQFKAFCSAPVGYEAFRPFRVGEYEYEKALVRISMTAGSVGSIPQIYDVVMNVDIDDTVDRGLVQLPAAETVVPYHKKYYTPPEVTLTLQGGNAGDGAVVPVVLSIGTESFKCVLQKADGSPAAGIISWTAVGY